MVERLTRQRLYNLVWSEPMQKPAPRFGISDVALKKTCAKWQFPVPERGYWARRHVGKQTSQTLLSSRPPGLDDEVIVGGGGRCWNSSPTDDEILGPLPPPPQFEESIELVRERVKKQIGRVPFPKLATTQHAAIARLMQEDEKRRERQRTSPFPFAWDSPLFEDALEKRRLRILNAGFLSIATAGGKSLTRGSDAREIWMTVGHENTSIVLDLIVHRSRPGRNAEPIGDTRLRLAIQHALGAEQERVAWQDEADCKLEDKLDEIAVEVVVSAEVQYRESRERSHQWRVERKAQLEREARQKRIEAERRERERKVKLEKERVDRLLGEAEGLRRANDIRAYVEATIEANRASENPASADQMARWSAWALAQAHRIDPVANGSFLKLGKEDEETSGTQDSDGQGAE